MSDAVTYGIELAVGAVSFVAGIAAWRASARWLAVALVAAGVAACVHAVTELAG